MVSLKAQWFLISKKSIYLYFLLSLVLLTSYQPSLSLAQDSREIVSSIFTHIFFSKCFIVVALTCRSVVYFELIVVYGVRTGFNFIHLHVAIQLYRAMC